MPRILRLALASLSLCLLPFIPDAQAQRARANVLYSDRPLPVRLGIEIGTGLTNFLNATPTMFPVNYPYSDGPDTIHMRFRDGFTPLFGFHFGVAGDFALSDRWSILAKVNYNERRGNWESTEEMGYIGPNGNATAPLTSELTLLLRYLTIEAFAKHTFHSFDDLYLGGGFAVSALISDHHDIRRTLGGPEDLSFNDFGTGAATGIKDYRVGYSFDDELSSTLLELKALVGYPIPIGYRWTLNPEVTLAFPLTQIFTSETQDLYRRAGYNATPNPLTITGILALRREL